jgi:hypothetical protein
MKTQLLKLFFFLSIVVYLAGSVTAQQAINHNSTRSNRTGQSFGGDPGWSFGFFSGAATGLRSSETNLFRGQGFSGRFSGDYFFGRLGLGLTSGFVSGKLNQDQINAFIADRQFGQGSVAIRSNPFNAYLLGGPSFKIGNKIQLIATFKGGLFYNQAGGMAVSHPGAVRPIYGFEPGEEPWQFGFNGGLSLSFDIGRGTALMVSTDLLHTTTPVQLLDFSQGIDIPVVEQRPSQILTTGITLVKKFGNPREMFGNTRPEDGLTGNSPDTRRILPTVNKIETLGGDEFAGSTTSTRGRRGYEYYMARSSAANVPALPESILPEASRHAIKTKGTGADANRLAQEPCGPVTNKITYPDGTVEEITFSCPEDAAEYSMRIDGGMPNRISMNVTVPKQTQGATFGERVNAGLQSAGNAVASGAGRQIIAGRLVRSPGNTADRIVSSHPGSGAAAASYAATGRIVNNVGVDPIVAGPSVNLYAREAGSGLATGRRSREAGSGLATGRRQYEPVFMDGSNQSDLCNPCLVEVQNPLYKGSSEHQNPLASSDNRTASGPDDDCDGMSEGLLVSLIDAVTGTLVASTRTDACGEYWFANVPEGVYSIQVEGEISLEKSYPVTLSGQSRMDIAGQTLMPFEQWQHIIYARADGSGSGQGKPSLGELSLVLADDDGDGLAERFHATGRLTDGTTRDFTSDANQRRGGGKASMQDFHFSVMQAGSQASRGGKASMSDLHFVRSANGYRVMATFSDGKQQDISELVSIQQVRGVSQFHLQVADTDDDGAADLIWSPRSNFGTTAQASKVSLSDLHITKANNSYAHNLNVASGDLDGDGTAEFLVGNQVSDFGFSSSEEEQSTGSANRPGNPIRGIIVKGGRNPGGDIVATGRTNALGEVELPGLAPGSYTITLETSYVISDAVTVDFRDEDSDGDGIDERRNPGRLTTLTASQNSQSLRSDHTGNLPVRWSPPEVLLAEIGSILSTLNELDQDLGAENPSLRTTINTTRSNIKSYRNALQDLSSDIFQNDVAQYQSKVTTIDRQFITLHQSLQTLGGSYQTLSNVLKTKHDTAKNSIGNIR